MQKEKEQPQLTCESCSDRKCITKQSVSATSWLLDHKQANTSLSFWEWKLLPLPLRFRISHFFVFSTCFTAIYLYLVGNHFWNKTLCFNNNSMAHGLLINSHLLNFFFFKFKGSLLLHWTPVFITMRSCHPSAVCFWEKQNKSGSPNSKKKHLQTPSKSFTYLRYHTKELIPPHAQSNNI